MADMTSPGPREWTAWCDGSALPNPGRMGWGAVLVGPGGECHTLSSAASGALVGCNNEAELRGVMATLRRLRELGARAPTVYCDNSVVVAQLGPAGAPAVRPIERLALRFDEARLLLRSFDAARVLWIPAHRNVRADALARAALGLTEPRRIAPPRAKARRR
jgi:ribonuclease HI